MLDLYLLLVIVLLVVVLLFTVKDGGIKGFWVILLVPVVVGVVFIPFI